MGLTGFHHACSKGHVEVAKLLLSRADLNINTPASKNYGKTSLYFACTNGHIEIVKLLIARDDLVINAKDSLFCETAFHVAFKNGFIEIVQLLLSRDDLDVNETDRYKKTAISCACANTMIPQEDIVRMGVEICEKKKLHPSEILDEEHKELMEKIGNA